MAEHNENNKDVMSQDDIEKLLLSASEESVAPDAMADDSPAKGPTSDPEPEPEAVEDDIISLEDVDRLMDIALKSDVDLETGDTGAEPEDAPPEGGSNEEEPEKPASEEDSPVFSQDDIDSLLGEDVTKDPSETGEEDFVSQDDIDNLLQGIEPEDQGEKDNHSTGGGGHVISQDDIDALLGEDGTKDPSETGEEDFVSQDDIDNLLQEDEAETSPEKDSDENAETEEGHVSQDDIDSLFQDADVEPGEKGGGAGGGKKERSTFIDQGELDRLLMTYEEKSLTKTPDQPAEQDSSAPEADGEDEDSILVSQEEINKLIGDIQDDGNEEESDQETSSEPAKSGDGDVISQDDIDKLLAAPEQNDDELDDVADVDDSDKVILDAEKEEEAPDETDTSPGDKWFKHRYVVACAASFLVVTCASILFLIFRTPAEDGERKKIVQSAAVAPNRDAPAGPSVSDADRLISLKDFVVMAPPERDDLTLITTHVSITLKDVGAADLIRKNKAFFRGIVYNTVLEALIPEEQKKSVNELILTSGIKTALNKALPKAPVQQVVLTDLNLI